MQTREQVIEHRSFQKSDEVRTFPHGRMEIVTIGGVPIGRMTFQPGWRWSVDLKPLVGTTSCEVAHLGYQVAGKLTVRMNDGTEIHSGPGDVTSIPPGHDAWVAGDEAVVVIDWYGASTYAKPAKR